MTRRRPLGPAIVVQCTLPLPIQPREPETDTVYDAIRLLRSSGFVVMRAGANHVVDGCQHETLELFRLARAVARLHLDLAFLVAVAAIATRNRRLRARLVDYA